MPLLQLLLGLFAATGLTAIVGSGGDDPESDHTDSSGARANGTLATAPGQTIATDEHVLQKDPQGQQPPAQDSNQQQPPAQDSNQQQPPAQDSNQQQPPEPDQDAELMIQLVAADPELMAFIQQNQLEFPPRAGEEEEFLAQLEALTELPDQPADQTPVENPNETPTEEPQIGTDTSDQTAPTEPETPDPEPIGGTTEVVTGRVTTLELPNAANLTAVRILDLPDHGNVTVNPDNTLALVLTGSDHTGPLSFSYEATYADGSTVTGTPSFNATPGKTNDGWGEGDFYLMRDDANGASIVEWGDVHRDVYVSGSPDALSLEDIARLEGLPVEKISGKWLADHWVYGSTSEAPLDQSAGRALWSTLTKGEETSHWLRLESGYKYSISNVIDKTAAGESELHPLHITSFGEGPKPVLLTQINVVHAGSKNIVFSDLSLEDGGRFISGANIMMDDITITGAEDGLNVQNIDNFTLRNSELYDIHVETPKPGDHWIPHANRVSGIFASKTDGILIENTLFDMIGWEEGYDPNLSLEGGQPPSIYSHNIYLQYNSTDVTVRDNIVMRGASFGGQIRTGGFIEGNVFLDNNAGVMAAGGLRDGEFLGNYTLYSDNIVTSAGHKVFEFQNGLLTGGIDNLAPLTGLVDNIITHLADPNNPIEQAEKTTTHRALLNNEQEGSAPVYDNTIVYNWNGSGGTGTPNPDTNVDGLNTAILDQTTIQNFATHLLGKPDATIEDLATYLRTSAEGALDGTSDAELIVDFFKAGFGMTPDERFIAETARFVPNDLAEGIRWDNKLNWSTEDLPGTVAGDSVDLAGNWVHYSGTTTLNDLDLGSGGKLNVAQGYLDVTGDLEAGTDGGTITIDRAGQAWINGYSDSDKLTLEVMGGRFANTGDITGNVDLSVGDNGQAILATSGASYEVGDGNTFEIVGSDATVGFDGQGGDTAVLKLGDDARLAFTAVDGELGLIHEFRSGFYDHDDADVLSGVQLGGAKLALDLSGMSGDLTNETLIEADEILGAFDALEISGLGGTRDAKVQIDYDNDVVRLLLSADGDGSGVVNYETLGVQGDTDLAGDDASALWAALTDGHGTMPEDMPPDLPEDAEIMVLP